MCHKIQNTLKEGISHIKVSMNLKVFFTQKKKFKCSPGIMYLLYETTTFIYLVIGVTDFLLTFKKSRTMYWPWPLVSTRDLDLCKISQIFRVWLIFAHSFWIVLSCWWINERWWNDDKFIEEKNYTKITLPLDCSLFKTMLRSKKHQI